VVRATALALSVLALAACGSTAAQTAAPPASCTSPKAALAVQKLARDTAAIRAAADLPGANTLKGNAAINRATDRFLTDVETAPIDNIARNRLIDHAAAALVGACQQCFQALEADRPVVWIAKGAHRGNCQK
jgi:hypothetical protein